MSKKTKKATPHNGTFGRSSDFANTKAEVAHANDKQIYYVFFCVELVLMEIAKNHNNLYIIIEYNELTK